MADIFLSYAREDHKSAGEIVAGLTAEGFSVWWDRDILGGADFATQTEKELASAKAVVVLWSNHSRVSKWVRDEAAHGRDNNCLVPVSLDAEPPPLGFRQVQAIDFATFTGGTDTPAFRMLVRSLRDVIGVRGSDPATPAMVAHKPAQAIANSGRFALIAGSVGVVAVIVAAVFTLSREPGPPAVARGEVALGGFLASPSDAERSARAAVFAAAFRHRLTEVGVKIASGDGAGTSEFILSGELGRDGAKDIFTARLDDRATGATLWTIRRAPSEGGAFEAELAAFALHCGLKRRDPALGAEVLAHYLKGCAAYLEGDMRTTYESANVIVDRAPKSAVALGYYAFASAGFAYIGSYSTAEREKRLIEARRLAEQALAIDSNNADALFAMGFTFPNPEFAEQERWWKRAVEADSGTGWSAGRYGNFLGKMGRNREALDMEMQATQHRRSAQTLRAAFLALSEGDQQTAQGLFDLVRPFDGADVAWNELRAYVLYGRIADAQRLLDERKELAGTMYECWSLVLAARRSQPIDQVRFADACGGQYDTPSFYALAGDVDGAYREMELLVTHNDSPEFPYLFGSDLKAFRADARFFPLAARLGLVRYWRETGHWPDFCADPDTPYDCKARAEEALPSSGTVAVKANER